MLSLAERIELFADDGAAPIAPSTANSEVADPSNPNGEKVNVNSLSDGVSLISHGVEEALKGDMVKSLLIPETMDLLVPNYVMDFRKVKKLKKYQVKALTSIIAEDGDTAIYVCLSNGLEKLGMGIGARLDRVLPAGVQSIFGDECMLYQDVEKGKPLREVKQQDVNKVRLRL